MSTRLQLDLDGVAEVGGIFLNGDLLEEVSIDPSNVQVDYDFDKFNELKRCVMKIERINPGLGVTCILWRTRLGNEDAAEPLVCGKALPNENWDKADVNPDMRSALNGKPAVFTRENGSVSNYYPIYNSDHEIAGFMELLTSVADRKDI
jgi:hypothetical protein